MKVAVTAQGMDPESPIDSRFGRCTAFAVFDTDDGSLEFVPNPNRDAEEGAGPASVALVANLGVRKIVSGEFGFKIKQMLTDLGIQMVMVKEKRTVQEIVALLE